jgi:hypothetical protein
MADAKQKTIKGAAKLHGLRRSQLEGVKIDPVKGKVNNEPGPTTTLWDATQGGEP